MLLARDHRRLRLAGIASCVATRSVAGFGSSGAERPQGCPAEPENVERMIGGSLNGGTGVRKWSVYAGGCVGSGAMKLVVQVKLLPTPVRASVSGYGFASPNGPPTPAGASLSWARSSRTRPRRQGCRWCTSIRHTPPAPAPNAATSTRRTGHPRRGSRAGPADSLIMQTATAPATFALARKSCGDAARSQPPQTHPRHPGAGQDASAAPQPVAPAVQARRFNDGSLTRVDG